MYKNPRVLVLAGGQSGEHEVSINSARSVLDALPKDRFHVDCIVISHEGRWLSNRESTLALAQGRAESGGELVLSEAINASTYDVVFPILHGPNGEDGTVQGMLKLAGIPFVGSGVLGSAVCMDKLVTKAILASHNIPQVAYQLTTRAEFAASPNAVLTRVAELGFPSFVKPANLGSSVGISKVHDISELQSALELAFGLDRRVIVEAAAPATGGKPRELEIGILGNDSPEASPVGELTFSSEFYDYATKYTAGCAEMHIPAHIPDHITEQVKKLALQAFKVLDCAGLARIDFFYIEASNTLLLNEVNTMPGFTKTSMYPELWRVAGLHYPELVSRLIELALEKR